VTDEDKIIMKCRTGSNDGKNGLNYKTKRFICLKHHYRTKVYHAIHYRSIKKINLLKWVKPTICHFSE
jgi:hypothetical protein